jgi:hypothetical protein
VNSAEPGDDGATAIGTFLLADDFLNAARVLKESRSKKLTSGPLRLLCLHSAELYLKAYLRMQGATHQSLRDLGHNTSKLATAAGKKGLALDDGLTLLLTQLVKHEAYVEARYNASEGDTAISPAGAVALATRLRKHVKKALDLDEFGMPNPR